MGSLLLIFLLVLVTSIFILRERFYKKALLQFMEEMRQEDVGVKQGDKEIFAKLKREFRRTSIFRRRSEEKRKEMLQKIVDQLRDALLLLDRQKRILLYNKKAAEIFKLHQDAAGLSIIGVFLDHRFAEMVEECEVKKILVAKKIAFDKFLYEDNSYHKAVFYVEIAPFEGESDYAMSVLVHDETQEHQIEQIRKDFVANASHELRTPLSIINGYIETLLEEEASNKEVTLRSLQVMEKHGQRISRIIDDMLMISRLESEELSLRLESFSLHDCLQDVLDRLESLIAEKKCKVAIRFPEKSVVVADRFYWDQIFFNLIENALKENQEGLFLSIKMEEHEDLHEISVSDNGLGIPNADQPFVFKRFYRVQKDHAQTVKGTGLGLSIVKNAIEAHRGTITLKSIPGQETVFTLTFPNSLEEALQGVSRD